MIIETVPVVIGALGLVKRGLGKYVEKIPANIYVEELQLNNDSPPAAPKETGCFSEPWTVQTVKEEKDNNNNNILVITLSASKLAIKTYLQFMIIIVL